MFVTLACPFFTYIFYFVCNEEGCPTSSFLSAPIETLKSQWPGWSGLYDHKVMLAYLAWFFGNLAMQYALPGAVREGVLLRDGSRLKYKQNGTSPIPASSTSMLRSPQLLNPTSRFSPTAAS